MIEQLTRQQIRKEIEDSKNVINQLHLTNIYRKFYPVTAEYTFYLNMCEAFSRLYHILGHKTGLSRLQKVEILEQKEILKNYKYLSIKQCFSNNTKEILKYLNEYKQKDNLEFMCAAQAVLQGRRIPLNVCKRNQKILKSVSELPS